MLVLFLVYLNSIQYSTLYIVKENTVFQVVGFVVLIILSIQFVTSFLLNGVSLSNASLWGHDWGDMFGVVLFNFAVVIAIPAWLYEKKPTVGVNSGECLLSVF